MHKREHQEQNVNNNIWDHTTQQTEFENYTLDWIGKQQKDKVVNMAIRNIKKTRV